MSDRIQVPKSTRHLQDLEKILRGEAPPPPIAQLLGLRLTRVEPGRVVIELDASARHANPMGTLHGGVICDLADLAMGASMATTLEDEESFTTLDLTSKFFKPIWNARLRATARVVKRTRTLGLIECEVEDDKGSLVSKVYSSCMVLRGDEARGR
ncbi:MAG TPA: PaaI family thioesterase [Cystobacter sp.]